MAKARGGSIPNQLRWGTITIPDLEEITVDSVTKFDRANDLLTTYQAKVEMAVVQAKWKKK